MNTTQNEFERYLSPHFANSQEAGEIRTGSDSDFKRVHNGLLQRFQKVGLPYLLTIKSAHRTPDKMAESAQAFPNIWLPESLKDYREQVKQQIKFCMGIAGGAAHIAGMTASETSTPVIALPVESSATGITSAFFSMQDMPPGISNGVVISQEIAVNMAQKIYNLELPHNHNTISLNMSLPMSQDIDMNLLNELGLTINQKSPVCINEQDLDIPQGFIEEKIQGDIPIIMPIMKNKANLFAENEEEAIEGLRTIRRVKENGLYMGLNRKNNIRFTNAILYAAQIIGYYNPDVKAKFEAYRKKLKEDVLIKDVEILQAQFDVIHVT